MNNLDSENGRGSVFNISVAIVSIVVVFGFLFPNRMAETADAALQFTIGTFGWFYLFVTFFFLSFALYLAFGPYGKIKLGQDDDEPDYSNIAWFAMLFSAGMGIGLVFWGVAEPIFHYLTPPMGAEGQTSEAARLALRYSFFHWGLHPWAIYTIVALAIAYAQFRKKESGLISSTFIPLLGERARGPIGTAIDILAVIATVFGVATSLGLGALQISGGLSYVLGIPSNITSQLVIILIVTILYMISASTGLNKGILILSNVNLALAVGLLLFVFAVGPTSFILDSFTTTIGSYLGNIIPMSFRLTPFTKDTWIGSWTLFYWAWWIAWAPFVGSFIARVSKGRTIKEFVLGVLVVPSIFGALWFSTFGGSALFFEIFENAGISQAVNNDMTTALFVTLAEFPLGNFLGILATLLIITFFITSADSATFVLGMFSSKGSLNPPISTRLIWGALQSSIAAALLISGGLNGLQTASIVAALPFAIVMFLMAISLNRALSLEVKEQKRKEKQRRKKLNILLEEAE